MKPESIERTEALCILTNYLLTHEGDIALQADVQANDFADLGPVFKYFIGREAVNQEWEVWCKNMAHVLTVEGRALHIHRDGNKQTFDSQSLLNQQAALNEGMTVSTVE